MRLTRSSCAAATRCAGTDRRRLVRRAGRSVTARRADRRTRAGPSRARHVRLARRQDDRIAAAMNGQGILVACDVRGRRIALLRRTVEASGATNIRVVQADVIRPLPFREPFDTVLVDAPCSGLGTLRRDPDIKWRRREDDLPALAAAQRRMLAHAAAVVSPGGRVIYAACSSEPDENEAVVDAFLEGAPQFQISSARTVSPNLPADMVDERGFLRTLPHVHALEAFFAAVLVRSA